jgi:hypothetical protein
MEREQGRDDAACVCVCCCIYYIGAWDVEMHEAVGAAARENENGIGLLFLLRYHASSQCPVFASGVFV